MMIVRIWNVADTFCNDRNSVIKVSDLWDCETKSMHVLSLEETA